MPGARRSQGRPQAKGAARSRERERMLAEAAASELPRQAEVCIIGGGAAGLACAIAARAAGARRVVVLERDLACGRTILTTGNGRCNFCNTELAPENYNQSAFVADAMGEPAAALNEALEFFRACGMSWIEEDGRLYPRSRQAASVRNVLLARCWREGITLAPAREVLGARRRHGMWYVSYRERWVAGPHGPAAASDGDERACAVRTMPARSVVIATGGATSGFARSFDLPLVPEQPVLCGIEAQGAAPGVLTALDGRRAHVVASLTREGRVVLREAGEVLFRPWGLSGIVSFNLSRHALPGDMVELDLAPEVDAWEVDSLVSSRPGDTSCLDGILDPVIAAELIALAGGIRFDGLAWRVAPLVKGLPFRVTGLADTTHAQVTRGGIATEAVCASTLAASGHPGLFACGEALDVDGACGGFNLAWAWLSGLHAGRAAALA